VISAGIYESAFVEIWDQNNHKSLCRHLYGVKSKHSKRLIGGNDGNIKGLDSPTFSSKIDFDV
jgi:hypothetical protein